MNEIKVVINDQEVVAGAGRTILQAATEAGIYIPTLCFHPALRPSGSCRLCAVEIDGYRGLPAACSTPIAEGMKIRTSTAKVQDFRKEMLRIILQDHPRECLGCPRNGTCELQQLVMAVGIDFPYPPPSVPRPAAATAGDYFERDYSLCVRCGRCVRTCHEIRGARAIVFRDRLGRQEVGTPFNLPLEQSGCQFCGACVDVCPTGALRENTRAFQQEPRGHIEAVCESLSNIVMSLYKKEIESEWKTAICPVCSAGCRLNLELTGAEELIQAKPDRDGPTNRGQACVQGRFLLKNSKDKTHRLVHPMARADSGYRQIPDAEAVQRVADRLKSYGPDEVAVLTDGRATNEELFALARFAKQALQTSHLGCLSQPGQMAVSHALEQTLGVAASTNSLNDLDRAGAILAIGFNPAATHPIAGTAIRNAVLNGTKLVVANPMETAIARYSDVPLRYIPGTERALVLGLARVLLDRGAWDPDFMKQDPEACAQLGKSLQGYDLGTVSKLCGVSEEDLVEAACVLGGDGPLAILYGHGLLQTSQPDEVIQAVAGLARVRGSFGKPGGGLVPAYGACNLQGALDLGFTADIPARLGTGQIKALYLLTESMDPELAETLKPHLENLETVIFQSTHLPPDGLTAELLLPMAALLEKEGSLTNSERRVQWSEPVFTAPGKARSLLATIGALTERTGGTSLGDDPRVVLEAICDEIAGYAGIGYHRARFEPVQWPCPDAAHAGSPTLFADAAAPSVSAILPALEEPAAESVRDSEFPFALVVKEALLPFLAGPLLAPEIMNTMRHNGDIEMNPADAYSRGYQPGGDITVVVRAGELQGRLALNKRLPPLMIAVPAGMLPGSTGVDAAIDRVLAARVSDLNAEEPAK